MKKHFVIALLAGAIIHTAHAASDLDMDDAPATGSTESTDTTALDNAAQTPSDEGLAEDLTLDDDSGAAATAQKPSDDGDDLDKEFMADDQPKAAPTPKTEAAPEPEIQVPEAEPAQTPEAPPPPPAPPQPEAAPPTVATQPSDEPNVALEKRLHDIYLKYQQNKIDDSQWMSIVSDKRTEEYKIQSGDTLWDVSQTFFGDGNFWPKVWSMNSEITNPHFIVPGNSIVFTPGDFAHAPKVAINEGSETPTTTQTAEAAPESAEDVEIPPPTHVSRPVLKKIPPSFPLFASQIRKNGDLEGFDSEMRIQPTIPRETLIPEYMVDNQLPRMGKILETEGENDTAGAFQYVFVKMQNPLQVGDKLVSYHYRKNKLSDYDMGLMLELEGEMTVTDVIDADRKEYKVLITRTIYPVQIGSQVMPGRIPVADFSDQGSSSQVHAQIIGGQLDEIRRFASTGSFIYLNKGERDGLHENELLSVIANQQERNSKSSVRNLGQPVGLIKIVKTSNKYATALVINIAGPIYTGDTTADPSVFASSNEKVKAREAVDIGYAPEPEAGPGQEGASKPADKAAKPDIIPELELDQE